METFQTCLTLLDYFLSSLPLPEIKVFIKKADWNFFLRLLTGPKNLFVLCGILGINNIPLDIKMLFAYGLFLMLGTSLIE